MFRSKSCLWILAMAIFVMMGLASTSEAQSVMNPSVVTFNSPDHDQVTKYELGFFLLGATDPVQIVDIGKPGCAPGGVDCSAQLPSRPVPINQVYVAKARAVGASPALVSPWSEQSNDFGYAPFQPSRPVVAR